MVELQFFGLLRMLLKRERIELQPVERETVAQLLARAQQQLPYPFLPRLLDDAGGMHAGAIILVNRQNVHHLDGLQTPVRDADVVAIFPPGAGG